MCGWSVEPKYMPWYLSPLNSVLLQSVDCHSSKRWQWGVTLSPTCSRSYLCGPDLISVCSGQCIICWGPSLKTPAVSSMMVLQSYVSLITFFFLACEKILYCRSALSANNLDPAWGEFVKPHLITLTPKPWGEFDKVYFLVDDTLPQSFLPC